MVKGELPISTSRSPALPRRLYRYFTERAHAESFVAGEIRIKSLSAYHEIEDDARRDDHEAAHRYDLPEGAMSTGPDTTQPVRRYSMTIWNWARADRIFALCLSTEHDERLFAKFNASVCVEISNPKQFIRDLGHAVRQNANLLRVHAERVAYYEPNDRSVEAPEHAWKAAFLKRAHFHEENEFRVVFSPARCLAMETIIHMGAPPEIRPNHAPVPAPKIVRLQRRTKYFRIIDRETDPTLCWN